MNARHLLDRLERRWPPSLIRYRQCVRVFLKWLFLRGVPLGSLSTEHARDFLAAHRAVGALPSTLHFDNFSLRHFFRWGRRQHLWPIVPLENSAWRHAARRSPRPTPFRRYFSELDALLRYQSLPDSRLLNDYSADLRKNGFGYRQIKFILANIATFLEFLLRRHKRTTDASRRDVDSFFHHAPYNLANDHGKARVTYVLRFLAFANPDRADEFRIPPRYPPKPDPFGSLGRDFLDFCRLHRGLRPSTCRTHRDILISFDSFLTHRGITNLRRLSPNDIEAFFLARSLRLRPSSQMPVLGALRSFFRFLHLKSHLAVNWAPRLPSPSIFSANRRPKSLPWPQVEQFLASIDRSSPLGKRDYAMALLMATLGIRSQELPNLRTQDVDLPNLRLYLQRRKDDKPDVLPLSQSLAHALRDYLAVRPKGLFDDLFLSVRPPVKPLGFYARDAVAFRLAKHFHRHRSMRVYFLRHSFAKHLLDNGAPLPKIGDLLGHQSLSSTLIYTRADVRRLRDVADNYAVLLPRPPGMKDG